MTDLAVSHGILDQPGTVAFLVIFGMAVILFFVFRSMAKHLRKVQMAARAEAEAAAQATAASGDGSALSKAASGNPGNCSMGWHNEDTSLI